MSRTLTRPSMQEIASIKEAFIERRLTPYAADRLRIILAWAEGAPIRAVSPKANEHRASREKVRRTIHEYARSNLEAFIAAQPRRRGRQPVPADKAAAIVEEFQSAFKSGRSVSYRELAAKHRTTLNYVARLAKKHRLDPKSRRGLVGGSKQ